MRSLHALAGAREHNLSQHFSFLLSLRHLIRRLSGGMILRHVLLQVVLSEQAEHSCRNPQVPRLTDFTADGAFRKANCAVQILSNPRPDSITVDVAQGIHAREGRVLIFASSINFFPCWRIQA